MLLSRPDSSLIPWLLFLGMVTSGQSWHNEFGELLDFKCPAGQTLTHLESFHSNQEEDRKWYLECDSVLPEAGTANCEWSGHGYVSDHNSRMLYQCPGDSVIAGMMSEHSDVFEDRVFRFYCCNIEGYVAHACYYTEFKNEYDKHLDYTVPSGMVIKGIYSEHHNHHQDRIFRFEVCKVGQLDNELRHL